MYWLVLLLWGTCLFAESFGSFYDVQLVRVIDGDTIVVDIEGVHPLIGDDIALRIEGIDTPELRGKCEIEKQKALEAKKFVEDILKEAEVIDLHSLQRDKYFRIVTDVWVNGESLSQLLLSRDLATRYNGGTKSSWCMP